MRKHNSAGESAVMRKRANRKLTVGIDLGNFFSATVNAYAMLEICAVVSTKEALYAAAAAETDQMEEMYRRLLSEGAREKLMTIYGRVTYSVTIYGRLARS
jgi:hypothetical protein